MAKKKLLKAKPFAVLMSCVCVTVVAVGVALPIVANHYDLVLRDVFGVAGSREQAGTETDLTANLDKKYNKSEYASENELKAAETKYVREAGSQGFVLLKNDNSSNLGLPLNASENKKVSLFSHSSVDVLLGGTGSGLGYGDVNLKEAFEQQGFEVNQKLWDFYSTGAGSSYKRGEGSIQYGMAEDWKITECPISVLQAESDLLSSTTGSTAIFVLSRTGGEGRDLGRYMGDFTSIDEDKNKSYLEPDSVELGVLSYLNDHFSNVVVLVNTNNVIELGWVKNYPNIKSVLWTPGAGGQTANSIVDVLSGKVAPSGHLVDTMAYDAFSSPAMVNMGDFAYTVNGQQTGQYGVSYDEGIYVGYKYYETRYFDKVMNVANVGTYNYSETVQFPFGYGLSYTNFTWSGYSQTAPDANGDITVSVKVKNTGTVKGADVVQVYANLPYTDFDKTNHIEKSAVNLVGFEKTKVLDPQEEVTVSVKVNKADLVSYDDVVNKTFILEDGKYQITAAENAHSAANNFLAKEGKHTANGMTEEGDASFVGEWNNGTLDKTSYSVGKDGKTITNRFDKAMDIARNQYLTRNDWTNTWPKRRGNQTKQVHSSNSEVNGYQWEYEISEDLKNKINAKGTAEAANSPITDAEAGKKAYAYAQEDNGKELIDIRGKAYDEIDWESIVGQMKTSEVGKIMNSSGYETAKAATINKPKVRDLDGPMGLNNMATHEPYSISYPAEVTLAASWDRELSAKHGSFVAEDGLKDSVKASGWYAPAVNIHRTPFAGRNFEYYSEDGFLSGMFGKEAVVGAAKKGMYSFIKHFALNDQEDHRTGVATWCNEQAMREIYFAPFRRVIESGTVTTKYYEQDTKTNTFTLKEAQTPAAGAVMSSFNRIGYTWAGGDYRLITEVLRNEWGFNGFVLTDYSQGATSYMHAAQMLRAGGDAQLSQYGGSYKISTDADRYYTQKAMTHILYTVVNSNGMNGFAHGVKAAETPFAYWVLIVIALEVVFAAGVTTCVLFTVKRFRDEKKELAK